jgi:hypothetical protein
MDKAGFLAWVQGREERHELVERRDSVYTTFPCTAHADAVSDRGPSAEPEQ